MSRIGIDELNSDTQLIATLTYASLQHISSPKLTRHLPHV